jgi:hypothetical protein
VGEGDKKEEERERNHNDLSEPSNAEMDCII